MFSREMEAKEDEVAACEGAKEGHKMMVHFILLFFSTNSALFHTVVRYKPKKTKL